MDPDLLIIRHPEYGVSEMISKTIDASIINAGDGSHDCLLYTSPRPRD